MRAAVLCIALLLPALAAAQSGRLITVPQSLPPVDNPKEQPANHETNPGNRGTSQVPFIVKELPRERTAEEAKEASEKATLDREVTRYTSDLATYTKRLFAATCLLAIVTLALAVAAFLQIQEGRRGITAAEDAAKAAAASAKSNEALANASTASQRAFVFVRIINVDVQPGRLQFTITWENGGLTATRHARMQLNWGIFPPTGIPDDFQFPDYDEQGQWTQDAPGYEYPIVIAPKATALSWTANVSTEVIDRVVRNECRLFLWGWLDYDDIFQDTPRHRTEHCTEYVVQSASVKISEEGVPVTTTAVRFVNGRRFNGADEDCYRQPRPYAPPKQTT